MFHGVGNVYTRGGYEWGQHMQAGTSQSVLNVLPQNCYRRTGQNHEHAKLKQQLQPHGVRKLLDLHIPPIFCAVDNY